MKPPSSDALALAQLGGALLDGAVGAILLFAFANAYAPPQDLPWKPLRLDDPIGLATGGKIARVAFDPEACRSVLREGGIAFLEAETRTDGFCTTENTLRITAGLTPLAPPAPVMTCQAALGLALWDRQVLRPAAEILLDGEVARIDHYGTYACRRVYGREGGRVSEHARANAFDLAGVRLKDGRRITVASDFRDQAGEGVFLRVLRGGACETFRTVLSPDYNAAHADHLHLDMGRFDLCR